MRTGCLMGNQQPPMLQAVFVQTRENRRARMTQFISPAVSLIDCELVGHCYAIVQIVPGVALLNFTVNVSVSARVMLEP
jgi:hypothetical protein